MPHSFLALSGKDADYDRARFAVLPLPYDATTSFQVGTRNGPAAIITASQQLEEYDEELKREPFREGIATLPPLMPDATGPEPTLKRIERIARKIVKDGKFMIALGGEHTVSSALVKAIRSKHKKLSVLQIDAHSDLRDTYMGTPYSHACVMRRIAEMSVDIVPVGIRAYSGPEDRFMKDTGITPITGRMCNESNDWIDDVVSRLGDTVYVTIDIDGFDPAYAPGTGTPEPGGIDYHQAITLLRRVAETKTIVAADIVEVMPIPGQAVTEFLAARLAYKIMGYVSVKRR